MEILLLIIWGVCAFCGHSIAKSKGADASMGAILGLLFGPIGLIVVALLPAKKA